MAVDDGSPPSKDEEGKDKEGKGKGWTLSHTSCGPSCFIAQIAFSLTTFGHRLSIHPAVIINLRAASGFDARAVYGPSAQHKVCARPHRRLALKTLPQANASVLR